MLYIYDRCPLRIIYKHFQDDLKTMNTFWYTDEIILLIIIHKYIINIVISRVIIVLV